MIRVLNIFEDGRLSGGPQRRIANIAQPLYDQGIDTIVLIPEDESAPYVEYMEQRSVRYHLFNMTRPTLQRGQVIRYLIRFIPEIFSLARYMKASDIHLVHVSGGAWQIKGVMAGKLAGKKTIWHLNDAHVPKLIYRAFRLLQKLVNYFFIASVRVEDYYFPGRGPQHKYFIGAPVDCSRFNPQNVDAIELSSQQVLNVVTVGQISPVKNIELLVNVAAVCRTNVHFHFVGPVFDGQLAYFEQIKALVEEIQADNVTFHTGICPHPERYLKAADAYFCSSRSEASPTAVWEAMSMELPVVATDVSDLKKMADENGKLSLAVFAHDDIEGIAGEFEKMAARKQAGTLEIKNGNRQFVEQRFDKSIIVEKHRAAYEEIHAL